MVDCIHFNLLCGFLRDLAALLSQLLAILLHLLVDRLHWARVDVGQVKVGRASRQVVAFLPGRLVHLQVAGLRTHCQRSRRLVASLFER